MGFKCALAKLVVRVVEQGRLVKKYNESKLAIIGLGYVGLPLAVEFGKSLETVEFDIDKLRVEELRDANAAVDVYDPWADTKESEREFGIRPIAAPDASAYDAVVMAVAHSSFRLITNEEYAGWCKRKFVVYDIKCVVDDNIVDGRL